MARDPLTVKNPGCFVLLGWLQALEQHRVISSKGNFHETALWGHPALGSTTFFFPRKAASSPKQVPNNVDLRNINKNKQEKEASGNLGKAGRGAAQWKASQRLKKSSLLFVPCTRVNAMKPSLGARYLAGTRMFLFARMEGLVWTPSESQLSIWKPTGRLTMMVEVLPEGTRHCALPVSWVMDASPWDKVSISRHHIKTLQSKGPLCVTLVAVNNWTYSWLQNRAASKKSSTGSSTVPLNNNFSTRWF